MGYVISGLTILSHYSPDFREDIVIWGRFTKIHQINQGTHCLSILQTVIFFLVQKRLSDMEATLQSFNQKKYAYLMKLSTEEIDCILAQYDLIYQLIVIFVFLKVDKIKSLHLKYPLYDKCTPS